MKNLLMAVVIASLLSGCASTELATKQIDSAAMKQASQATITPAQAIENARHALLKAKQAKLDFYTPLHFKSALASLKKIEVLQEGKADAESAPNNLAIITEAFKTQELMNEAYQAKTTIENTLSASLAHKAVLDELAAKNEFPKDYNGIMEDLSDLFKLIENNKVEKARQEELSLLTDMVEIEINTLVKIYVAPAQFVLDKAEDFDADDYAEKTFEQAELAIERAETFIAANSRNISEVKKVGHEALIAAKRALNIGKLSKTFVELDEDRAELKALEMEALLATVIRGFAVQDLEGLTLEEQAQELAQLAREQARKIAALSMPSSPVETLVVNPEPGLSSSNGNSRINAPVLVNNKSDFTE